MLWRLPPSRGPGDVFDRDLAVISEILVFDLSADGDVMLKPLFDDMWNGGGWSGSPHYQDGRWHDI
jgi:hypothetical protein